MKITLFVWRALLLRESIARLFSYRAAWFWLLMEPVFHVAYLMVIFAVIRVRHIGGISTEVWIMVGLLAFFAFRRTAIQCMNAVHSNQALFTYRQVKPIDTVLVRAVLEACLIVVVGITLLGGFFLAGLNAVPSDPLGVFIAFLGMWLFGVGFGLVMSVVVDLLPEVGQVVGLVMGPMYFLSGVVFPVASIPPPYREWLMFNPVAHGLEAVRLGYADHYYAVPELSVSYLYGCALLVLFIGLALHRRFALSLVTR